MIDYSDLLEDVAGFGLVLRGGFRPESEDEVPCVDDIAPSRMLLLLGNAGSSLWSEFVSSPEYADGHEDPLNRWSRRIGEMLAVKWGGKALFPFGGPPYLPFIHWARKAEGLRESALGMLMHPDYGLWHAYRFAVALPFDVAGFDERRPERHACDHCRLKPCLDTCPVNAFDGVRYDVGSCYRYLKANPHSQCHTTCRARNACPEGSGYRYEPDHAGFHMEKFYSALRVRFGDSESGAQVE